jgi:Fic family protein
MSSPSISESLSKQLARLDAKRARFAGLSAPVIESLYGRLRVELTYSSNALEGNTLSLRETQMVVEEGLTPLRGKSLREIYEARNHFAAIKEIENWVAAKREVSARALLDLHQIVMRDLDDIWGGRLRNGPVFIIGARHTPPNATLVSDQLDALISWAAQSAMHPVLTAAETHFRFDRCTLFLTAMGVRDD